MKQTVVRTISKGIILITASGIILGHRDQDHIHLEAESYPIAIHFDAPIVMSTSMGFHIDFST